jgi:ABC-type nickel/cobalt efflux system permease component RcnA
MDVLMIFGLGLLLGMQHATDADHLAAVATLATREHSLARALRLGAAWGLGHSLVLLVVAGAVTGLGWVMPPQWALRFEQAVGVLLIMLGARLAWRLWKDRVHFHGHGHPGRAPHFHGHSHDPRAASEPRPAHATDPHRHAHRLPAASMLVGMLHGLAGSAALALLALGALPTPAMQLGYITTFGIGSIVGMAFLTGALSVTLRLTAKRLTALNRSFTIVIACSSIAIGGHLAWSST